MWNDCTKRGLKCSVKRAGGVAFAQRADGKGGGERQRLNQETEK